MSIAKGLRVMREIEAANKAAVERWKNENAKRKD